MTDLIKQITLPKLTSHNLIWLIYLLLLGVLLPHTAWAFAKFEPSHLEWVAWGAAFAFECAIAVLTHSLARHIETTANHRTSWRRLKARYLNAYGGGLLISWLVSTLANLAHSVEFGTTLKIFADYGIPAPVYAVAFGAILPTTSLLFARILSGVIEDEAEPNEEIQKANEALRSLRERLGSAEARAKQAEQNAAESELRFQAAGDLFVKLVQGSKRERILAAMERWPQLPANAIAIITETSPSYVSEVKSEITS